MTYTDAPASVTYSIISKDGFTALFSIREESGGKLLEKMSLIEPALLKEGYKPHIKSSGGFTKKEIEIVPDRKCPMCGNDLVYQVIKGEKVIKCSTNKWDFATKQATGCKFIEWPKK